MRADERKTLGKMSAKCPENVRKVSAKCPPNVSLRRGKRCGMIESVKEGTKEPS